tara:strand:+ start:434 stop:928 length:495 start_codon:yes stop_codon:yes gene_type:complete
MKVFEIIIEDADGGSSMAGNFASVSFPLFGKKKMIRRAVDPKGYLGDGKLKLPKVGYNKPVKVNNVAESVTEKVYKKNPDDPMDPEVAVPGMAVYSLKGLERDVKRMFEDLAKQADEGNWENIDYYLHKHGVLSAKVKAIASTYEDLENTRKRGGRASQGIIKR